MKDTSNNCRFYYLSLSSTQSVNRPTSQDSVWALIENSQDIIIVIEADGSITFVNQAIESTLGYEPEELIGTNAFELIHEDDRADIRERFASVIEQPGYATDRVQFRMYHRDGSVRWAESIGSNQQDTGLDGFVINTRDITQRKRNEHQLEESQRFLADVLNNVEAAVWMRDTESRYLLVNNEFRDLFDISDDVQVVGEDPVNLFGEELGEQFRSTDSQAYQAGETIELQEMVPIDGQNRHYQTQITPLYDSNGEPYATCGIAADITEQKEIESALRERNKELEALHFTAALFATRSTPIENLFEDFVREFPKWFQYPEQTEVCVSFNDIVVESAAFDADHVRITSETKTPDERAITIDIGYSAGIEEIQFLKEERQLVETIATFLGEAVGSRQQEEQLNLFRLAVREAGHAVLITNNDGTIEYVNPAFEAQSGYTKEEAIGSTPRILKSGKHDQAFYEQLWDTILSGEKWTADLVNRRKNGSLYFVDLSIAPIRNAENEITHFVAIESEITQRRLREQKIQVLNRILRHNLRNSLNVIDGHTSLIGEEIQESALKSSVEAIHVHVDQLISLSDKSARIRDFFNTDDDDIAVCDLTILLRELEGELQEQYPDVNFIFDYPPTAKVQGDNRLKVALEEAIENAIVHNDHAQPSVTVTVKHPDNAHQMGGLDVYVSDNGPGIPEGEQSVIEAGTETSLEHGSGIGLWTIVWIVSSFGGEVSIENQEPRGTRLILHLPVPTESN